MFMQAYIFVISIGAIVRFFFDYPMWNALVLAVTVSSAFFAMESMLSTECQSMRETLDIIDFHISEEKKNIGYFIDFHVALSELSYLYMGKSCSPHNMKESIEASFASSKSTLDQMEEDTLMYRKKLASNQKTSNILAIVGYVLLFSILLFYQHSSIIPLFVQEIITVLSFISVLCAQLASQCMDESYYKEIDYTKKAVAESQELLKEMMQHEKELYLAVASRERKNSTCFETEEKKDAN